MNLNQNQALQDEEAGIDEEGEDIDYDALYGGIDIDISDEPKSAALQHSYQKIFKDVAKQGVKEFVIGLGGTWGDLAELAGVNPGSQLPGSKARYENESAILNKMNQPGYQPSFSDIYALGGEEDITPENLSLPTSQNLREASDLIGGPGEAETTQGKYAGRIGRNYGSSLAFGQANPVPALASGTVGQFAEESGVGPLGQAAAEIATILLTQGRSGKNISNTGKKEVQDKVNQMRKLGYTDEEITLAINSASKGKSAGVTASKGAKTEKAFQSFKDKSEDVINDILTNEIPGFEKGPKAVHQLASDVYGEVAEKAKNLKITKVEPFFDSLETAIKEVKRNLGNSKEAKDFIERLTSAGLDAVEQPHADSFINFYKELNSMGNWMTRNQKDRIITNVKDSIKNTFKSEGKEGAKLAEEFEKVNAGIRKAYLAEDVSNIISKSTTQEGMNFDKLNKAFDKRENIELFEEVLGKKQSDNLQKVSSLGKEIKDYDKAWKSTNLFKGGLAADITRTGAAAYFLYEGNYKGLATVLATKGGTAAAKKIAEMSLTDPKFQNLWIRGLHALKNGSTKSFRSINQYMKKYLDDEGIDIDLD